MRTNLTAGMTTSTYRSGLEIPGYVSARRFKLEEGEGVLRYLCIWELRTAAPYAARPISPTATPQRATGPRSIPTLPSAMRGLYKQIYPAAGAFEDHSGFHPEELTGLPEEARQSP